MYRMKQLFYYAAIPAIILPLLSPLYIRSLNGFNDVKTTKLKKGTETEFIKSDIKANTLTKALFWRDFKSVLREPTWFVNGPVLIIIMPIVFIISIGASLGNVLNDFGGINGIPEMLNNLSISINNWFVENPEHANIVLYIATGILSLLTVFSGVSTNIATTAISREGKGFQNLLAMPIPFNKLLKGKMIHAMLYIGVALIPAIIVLIISIFLIQPNFSATEIIQLFVNRIWLTTSLSFILN